MPDENLLKYIRDGLAQGRTEDILRPMLASAGWAQKDVDDAFVFVKTNQMPSTAPVQAAPAQTTVQPIQQPSPLQSRPVVQQPAVSAPAMASAMPEDRATPLWRNSRMILGLVIFIVCLGGVGVAFAYYSQSSLSPDQVLSKSLVAMQSIKTESFFLNGTSTIQIPTSSLALIGPSAPASGTVLLTGTASGSVDISDPTSPKESLTFNISASTGTAPTFAAAVEYIGLGSIYYIKIDNVDLGPAAATPNPITAMTQFFVGSWFKIDLNEIKQMTAQQFGTSTLSVTQSSTQLSADQTQQIKALVVQYPIVTVDKTLPGQTINGQDTYHYSLTVNKANLATVIGKASSIVSGQAVSDAAIASTTALLDNVNVKDLEVWIGKNDFYVYKATVDMTVSQGSGGGTNEVQLSDVNSDYNQPVIVTAPTGAKDVAQILQGFMGGLSTTPATPK